MTIIEQKIRLVGSRGSREVVALFDNGATYSIIQSGLAREIARLERLPSPKHFGTAEKGRKVTATECARLDFRLNGYTLSDEFMVVPGITEAAIIGAATMQKWRMKLDFDDAYQYVAAEKHNLTLVSFDADFDRTDRGRKTPAELLEEPPTVRDRPPTKTARCRTRKP